MNQSTPVEPLATPTRARVVDQIVEILTDAVISGRFAPGTSLPPERDLAAQLEVNRTSLRQALSRLEQLGLVASHQGRGTIVLDPVENPDPHVMSRLIDHVGPSLIAELFEVRGGIVAWAARLAAERATEADVVGLRAALRAVGEARGSADRQLAEMLWFTALVDATHNRALRLLVGWVGRAYGDAAVSFEPAFADEADIVAPLETIVRAIERHRPAAAERAMLAYAGASGARMLAAFEHRRPGTR
jgi:GntR family transcriptional regulator, transcriptional repressor for pyruvate dehydrogenase complex